MKKIEAIIRLQKFDEVRDALAEIDVKFFTLKEVKGYGLQKGETMVYRGSVYGKDYIARLQVDILTTSDKADEIIDTILSSAGTGEVGDGKITVIDVEKIYRIRNADQGAEAL